MSPRLLACACLALCLAAAPASGASLASATLSIRADNLGVPPVFFPATGATGTATGPGQVTLGAGSAFAGTVVAPISLPSATGVRIEVLDNAAGLFAGSPLSGSAIFRAQARLLGLLNRPIPIDFGAKYTATDMIPLPTFASFPFYIRGNPWEEVSNGLTAMGVGVLNLASPVRLDGFIPGYFSATIVAELELVFVPEPSTALLCGWGIVCLAVAGRRRLRVG